MTAAHDVVIVGGGNAGVSLAARLIRDGARDVAVIEPSAVHTYRPLLSYVGGGAATLGQARRAQRRVMPRRCRWYQDAVIEVDPVAGNVRTAGGRRIGYSDLVLCPGSTPDWDALPGSREAMGSPHASTNYLPELAPKTSRLIHGMRSGVAVFTVPDGPVPCGGVAYKPLFLACDYWRRAQTLSDIHVLVAIESSTMFGLPVVDAELKRACQHYGVDVQTSTTVSAIRAADRSLTMTGPGGERQLHYDLLHLTPRHKAPEWLARAGLADGAGGFVRVDPNTLRHPTHKRIWAIGDAAQTASSKSGGALRKQVPIVAHNIAAQRLGRPMQRYNGYSVAPIATARGRLLLAEFDRDLQPQPSFGLAGLARSRPWTYAYDLYLQPAIYWRGILRGRV